MDIRKILSKGEEAQIKKSRIRYYAFWGIMGYVAVGTTVYFLVHTGVIGQTASTPTEQIQTQQAPIETLRANVFAEQFAKEYFTWTAGDQNGRAQKLEKFLALGVDPQAGLQMDSISSNSIGESARVADVILKDDNTADFVVYTESELEIPDPNNPKATKRYLVPRYLSVPIRTNGKGFAVIDNPHIVPPPEKAQLRKPEIPKGEAETTISDSITSFLTDQFFPTYTNGTEKEISYLMVNGHPISGYDGLMSFDKIEEIQVYKEEHGYRVECSVLLKDNGTNAEYNVPFTLYIDQKGNQWLVRDIQTR